MNEADRRDFEKTGRRATDAKGTKNSIPSPRYHLRSGLFSGFVGIGGVTALLAIGRASNTLDTVVDNTNSNTKVITEMLITQTELMGSINKNSEFMNRFFEQQKDSDKEFLDELKSTKEKLNNLEKGIIVIQNGRVSATIDKNQKLYSLK